MTEHEHEHEREHGQGHGQGHGQEGRAAEDAMQDAARNAPHDVVEDVLRQWHQVHPGLDTAPMAVIGRLNRCAALLQHAVATPIGHENLTRAEFDILGALRRTNGELTPGGIARETFASGAAVTKRLKELERRGLVVRRTDRRDRRVAHLSLTGEGRALMDRLLPDQLRHEASLLSGLNAQRRDELSAALSELLVLLEGRLGGRIG